MKQKKVWPLLLAASLVATVFTGCKKDKPEEEEPTGTVYKGNGTFILCEGGFNQSNARIDFLNKNTDSLYTDIYQKVNGVPLGDVLQSMIYVNDRAYLVVNNSSKIEVVDPLDFTHKATISGFTSPRYACITGTGKVYVSDLFSNKVSIVNTTSLAITGNIPLPGWTEEMLNDNGKVWITNSSRDYAYIVQNDVVTDSVNVGYGSASIRKDNNGSIWILTAGNYPPNAAVSRIVRLNPTTNAVDWTYDLPDNGASKLRLNGDKSVLYFLYDGKVYRKNTGDNATPAEFISLTGKSFYGINVDPANGNIWLGDAGAFTSGGTVYVFNSAGTQIKSFMTGIAPTDFVF